MESCILNISLKIKESEAVFDSLDLPDGDGFQLKGKSKTSESMIVAVDIFPI